MREEAAVWMLLRDAVEAGQRATLLLVVDSTGSSPGRRGFKMAVVEDGRMAGSIGGGIMEHKFVELARDRMQKGKPFQELRRQIHSKDVHVDQSGMICSGEQTILLQSLSSADLTSLRLAVPGGIPELPVMLTIRPGHFMIDSSTTFDDPRRWWRTDRPEWRYTEGVGIWRRAFVFGGGHVGVAMCQLLHLLGHWVVNIDDRPGLNTMEANAWANEKLVLPYEDLSKIHGLTGDSVVVLVTFGYRTDEVCLRQLAPHHFRYLGMMGSQAKVDKMMADLRADGFEDEWLARVHAPAGLPIGSQTPMEIALSIAAEIVSLEDRGRSMFRV